MNVVDVRRHLNEMRKLWRISSADAPFYASATLDVTSDLPAPISASEFSFRFVKSHHRQRPPRGT